jgi:hypothetical protein
MADAVLFRAGAGSGARPAAGCAEPGSGKTLGFFSSVAAQGRAHVSA